MPLAQWQGNVDVSLAEKVYLQLGAKVYASDQEIWFKAIVVDAQDHLPTTVSGVLYVDLINSKGKVVAHRLVKLTSGLGSGSFELNGNYPAGRYSIRAYTQWNRNFGDDFIFENYVNIVAPSRADNSFINALTLKEQPSGEILLEAMIVPSVVDSLDKKQISIYLNYKQGQDTLDIKKKKEGYPLVYKAPKNANWVTLTLGGNTYANHSETIVLGNNTMDVQFFPESGQLAHGFPNKIGIKALGMDGKGTKVSGAVFDQKGRHISNFLSNHLGMGTFTIHADSTDVYHARISVSNDSIGATIFTYPLPKVTAKGSVISYSKIGKKEWIRVSSNKLEGRIYIKVSSRGKDYFLLEGQLHKNLLIKDFDFRKLPQGIIVLTLLDNQKLPVAERLFFNHRGDRALDISMETDKKSYNRRERTRLTMNIPRPDSRPGDVSISVLAMNKSHFKSGLVNTIRSYFLLDSEIRGAIENPDYYFRAQTPEHFEALDALLLMQGWRHYKYPIKQSGNDFFGPERGIGVKGFVQASNKQKASKNIHINLTTFGRETQIYTGMVDSLGRFDFLLDDDYGSELQFLLNTLDAKGNKVNCKIRLDTVAPLQMAYRQESFVHGLDTLIRTVMESRKERVYCQDGI